MSHSLLEQQTALRSELDKIEDQLHAFAKIQLKLMREAAAEAGFDQEMDTSYRFLEYTFSLGVGEGGSITCIERGYYGNPDEPCGWFTLDDLILDGKNDEFKAKQIEFFKGHLKTIAAKKIQDAQKSLERARADLSRQQEELNKKLAALGEQA
jgi:hypothetical protein